MAREPPHPPGLASVFIPPAPAEPAQAPRGREATAILGYTAPALGNDQLIKLLETQA